MTAVYPAALARVACLVSPVRTVRAVCQVALVAGEGVACQIDPGEERDAVCSSLEAKVDASWICPGGGEGEACLIFPGVEVGVAFQIGHEVGEAC